MESNSLTPRKRNWSVVMYIIAFFMLLIGFAVYMFQVNQKKIGEQNPVEEPSNYFYKED